jgi:hypothetical protein
VHSGSLVSCSHMPPPIHQTFEAHNFVICTFAPRPHARRPREAHGHGDLGEIAKGKSADTWAL